MSPERTTIAVIGAGFAGVAMAIALKRAGIEDFLVVERGHDVGGTWRDNTYPGAACDVPSHLYSFSFAPNPDWSRSFSPQAEIQDYLRTCAERYGVLDHMRFGTSVEAMRWDESTQTWCIDTDRGAMRARFAVPAVGALSEPSAPAIPGLDSFGGTAFHTAAWDHAHDLAGRRVAVVGTGASAIQVVPSIQPIAGELTVFQRTAPWIIPRWDRAIRAPERFCYRRFPLLQKLARFAIYWGRESYVLGFVHERRLMRLPEAVARRHLARQVRDPELRRRLTPEWTIGCKRILISNDYYPALCAPNTHLVTEPIREITATGILTADGAEHPVDTIIFATGFHVTDFPAANRITGRNGEVLGERWRSRGMAAYKGTTVDGFPNLFFLVGPNTGLGHTSMVLMIESQVAYAIDCLKTALRTGAGAVEVRADAVARFNAHLQERMRNTIWTQGGCASWYLDAHGRNTTLWPGSTWAFRRITRRFDATAYVFTPRETPPADLRPADLRHADPRSAFLRRADPRPAGAGLYVSSGSDEAAPASETCSVQAVPS